MSPTIEHCSFCDKHKDRVGKLIVSHKVAICDECIDLCGNLLKDKKATKDTKVLGESLLHQNIADLDMARI